MGRHKAGLIGLGYIANYFHLPAWQKIRGCDLVAVCDADRNKLAAAGKKYGIKGLYADYRKLLENDEVDIVTVATPNSFHYRHTIDALNMGKHVIVEKPFAVTYRQAVDMIACARRNKRLLMCAQHNRFRPETASLYNAIRSGKLGNIYYAKATVLSARGVPSQLHYTESARKGGGPLYDSGSHLLDLAWWFMGCPKPSSVYAHKWRELAQAKGVQDPLFRRNYRSEDLCVAQVRFENGAVIFLEASYLINQPGDIIQCTLFGTKAGASWPAATVSREVKGKIETYKLKTDHNILASVRQLQAFIDRLNGKKSNIVPPEESAAVIRMIEAIHRSGEKGKVVYI